MFNVFGAFEDDALVRIAPDQIRKRGAVPTNGNVFFTIFQTFSAQSYDESEEQSREFIANFGQYPADFFDCIIIDECHRGASNEQSNWRDILRYFTPAVHIGLTATPKKNVNADTYEYFGKPVYTYTLKEGINDGFLTPFRVVNISTTMDAYTHVDDNEVLEGIAEVGEVYDEDDFNTTIEIKEREERRIKEFLDTINQDQKTLVFCKNQHHALMIRDLINQHAGSANSNYCHRVTADEGAVGEQHLRDFQDNEKSIPTVLTTSHKLSTGVDTPEVRNIVLLRPVHSMIEFKQIIGRGTRLFDGKDYFTIYDFVEASKRFRDPDWDGEPLKPEPPGTTGAIVCAECGKNPCRCEQPQPCSECGNIPCVCEQPPRQMVRIKLSAQNVRAIDVMIATSFWDTSGRPISAEAFIRRLFGDLPTLFADEDQLREIWSAPDTRKELLNQLADKGYSKPQLADLTKLVHGEQSDLFDVLNYIAYHKNLVPRSARITIAKRHYAKYTAEQQQFLDFVLSHYQQRGVSELDIDKLDRLLDLRYGALHDAKEVLGSVDTIRTIFIDFQKYLYAAVV